MLVKGIISAIYADEKKISVILPEYDNVVTQPLPIYGNSNMGDFKVNDFILVEIFNNDFSDGIVIPKATTSGASGFYSLEVDEEGNLWANYADGDSAPPFEYDAETGNLYYEI